MTEDLLQINAELKPEQGKAERVTSIRDTDTLFIVLGQVF